MKSKKHTVKVSNWKEGKLKTERHEFDSLEESVKSAKFFKGKIKIYDSRKELVHIEEIRDEEEKHKHPDHESYA